jgi:hypothetical protein
VTALLAAVGASRSTRKTEGLWLRLDPAFLKTAGWNPATETLTPPADHPLLGFRPCRVQGCGCHALPEGLCATCAKAHRRSDMGLEDFVAAGLARKKRGGEVICEVSSCPRPAQTRRLCAVHEYHRKRLGLPVTEFVTHSVAQPLPGFGGCRVAVCDRQAHRGRGLCRPHDVRWWSQHRAGQAADFEAWCQTASPVISGHAVILRGLTARVQAEILLGLQQRCGRDTISYLYQLRIFARRLLGQGAATIIGFDVAPLPRHVRALVQELQAAVSASTTAPEDEQHKDLWDMGVFGHGRKRLDFTVIHQPWLRDAAKHWVLEELPLRRGPNVVAVLRDHVNSIAVLGNSLRLHRPDAGMNPAALGRADIVAFLNRLTHQQSTGEVSAHQRHKTAQQRPPPDRAPASGRLRAGPVVSHLDRGSCGRRHRAHHQCPSAGRDPG